MVIMSHASVTQSVTQPSAHTHAHTHVLTHARHGHRTRRPPPPPKGIPAPARARHSHAAPATTAHPPGVWCGAGCHASKAINQSPPVFRPLPAAGQLVPTPGNGGGGHQEYDPGSATLAQLCTGVHSVKRKCAATITASRQGGGRRLLGGGGGTAHSLLPAAAAVRWVLLCRPCRRPCRRRRRCCCCCQCSCCLRRCLLPGCCCAAAHCRCTALISCIYPPSQLRLASCSTQEPGKSILHLNHWCASRFPAASRCHRAAARRLRPPARPAAPASRLVGRQARLTQQQGAQLPRRRLTPCEAA